MIRKELAARGLDLLQDKGGRSTAQCQAPIFFASFLNVWWFDFRVQKHPSNLGIASFCGNLNTKILVSSVESSHFLAGYFKFLEGAPFLEQRGCLTSIGKDFYWV